MRTNLRTKNVDEAVAQRDAYFVTIVSPAGRFSPKSDLAVPSDYVVDDIRDYHLSDLSWIENECAKFNRRAMKRGSKRWAIITVHDAAYGYLCQTEHFDEWLKSRAKSIKPYWSTPYFHVSFDTSNELDVDLSLSIHPPRVRQGGIAPAGYTDLIQDSVRALSRHAKQLAALAKEYAAEQLAVPFTWPAVPKLSELLKLKAKAA